VSDREHPGDKMLRLTLALCAGCGWLSAAVVLIDHVEPAGDWVRIVFFLAWLVFSPLCEDHTARLFRTLPIIGDQLARFVWVVQVVPVFLLPVPLPDALIFGSMILAQGHLFLASDDDRNAARCLAAAPLLGVIALAYAPSTPLLVLLPISAIVALTALVMLHGRITRRRIRRGKGLHEQPREVRARVLYVVPLGMVALGLALLIFLAQEHAFSRLSETPAELASAVEPLDPPPELPDVGRDDSGQGGEAGGYAPDLPFSGGSLPFSQEPVMKVRPMGRAVEGAAARGLRLRDVVLDDFGPSGIGLKDRSLPTTYSDADDGEVDGWTWVLDREEVGETLRYEVLARPLLVPRLGWTLLFSPHPMAAIRIPRVRYGPDQILVSPRRHDDWFDYQLQVVDRGLTAGILRSQRATHINRQFVQLPFADEALADVASLAEDLVQGATSDYQRVRRVVDHLVHEFTYDLADLDFEGTQALARFLQTKRGYCTHFASTATLMLRTQGIPCRVATGFAAHEWIPEERAWLVRERRDAPPPRSIPWRNRNPAGRSASPSSWRSGWIPKERSVPWARCWRPCSPGRWICCGVSRLCGGCSARRCCSWPTGCGVGAGRPRGGTRDREPLRGPRRPCSTDWREPWPHMGSSDARGRPRASLRWWCAARAM